VRKHEELVYGCMGKAGDKEMTFVLLSRDDSAPSVIAFWAHERVRLGKNQWGDAQIVEALECAATMLLERGEHKP
jgi:hypothetical protein